MKKNKYICYWIEDGILYGEMEAIDVTLPIAKKIIKFRSDNFPGDHVHLASMKTGNISITREARDYFSSKEGCVGIKKIALIVNSPLMNMLGNIFIKLSKPVIPTKLFTEQADAIKWLKNNS